MADGVRNTDRHVLVARVSRHLALAGYLANGIGGAIVFLFLGFFTPSTLDTDGRLSLFIRNLVVAGPFLLLSLPVGHVWVKRHGFAELRTWLLSGRPATLRERELALHYPARWVPRAAVLWLIGTLLLCLLNLDQDPAFISAIIVTSILGAVTSIALQYLLVERAMRPVVAVALAGSEPPPHGTPGVAARMSMAWMLGTGVPLLGLGALAVVGLVGDGLTRERILGAALALVVLGLVVGLLALRLASRSVSEPLLDLQTALAAVESGDLSVSAVVDDGSEVGRLQAGFNRMVAGLQERQRLHEAFGTFVDPGLTERVLNEGIDLAGEEVEVTVFFLDIRDFTRFAEQASPQHVVARLNDLFDLVVPIVHAHGGHANKFVGDALLAVFGAPQRVRDHADRAVDAACEVAAATSDRFGDDVSVGIGVNTGPVVAGTIGGGGRLDFTVVGDAVNTAARVEAATRDTGDVILVTETTLRRLSDTSRWERREPIALKGKSAPVAVYGARNTASGFTDPSTTSTNATSEPSTSNTPAGVADGSGTATR